MKGKSQSIEEATRIEAYLLSEKAGHPAGMDGYFWEQATAIVHVRQTAVAGAVKEAAAVKARAKAKPAVAVKAKTPAKPPTEVKPKAAAAKKPAAKGSPGKEPQLPLSGETTTPARKRASKK